MNLRSSRRMWVAALFAFGALATPTAQNAGRPAQNDAPRLAFEKFTLRNGLDVILSEDHSLPMVAVNVWYHVGPANEEPGRTGFAHLFEHLMFQGSKHTPADSHFQLLEAAGASGVNGTTDYDRTNYFETVPSNRLDLALWIESDRMGYLLEKVDESEFVNQQDVVRNERRQTTENRPYGIAEEAVVQLLYPKGHPYYASVIGSHADIQAAKLEDARQFFKRYYAPNNASLAIVGDFKPAEAKAMVEKYFGSLRGGASVPPISVTTPKITSERRQVVADRVELPRVYMAWLTSPIFKPGDADAAIAAEILGGGRAGRLYRKLVYEKQIAQTVSAQQQSLLLGSQFAIEVTARPGHTAEELERALDEELTLLRTTAPDRRELERAHNTIETRLFQRMESFNGVANRLNTYNHFLQNPGYLPTDLERYRGVTAESVLAFAKEQLQPSARVVVHAVRGQPDLGPAVPTPPASQAKSEEAPESINPEEGWRNEIPKPGPAQPLRVPAAMSAQLPNGLTLILSERKGLPIVSANLVVKTGSAANPTDSPGLASFTVAMLDQGTTSRTAPQIADEIAQIGATLTTNSTMDASTIATRALKKNFPAALDLVADVSQRPLFPAEEIERQRAARLGQLAQQRENAAALAGAIVAAVLYGSRHPYGYTELGTEPSVKALGRDAMVAFWKQHFVPNNAALVVAGDISMTELKALAEKAFGGWQKATAPASALGTPAAAAARVIIVDRPGAPQTQLRVAGIGMARSAPDYQAAQVLNAALGGLFSSRINMNLREQHGYTYGAYSQFAARRSAGPFVVGGGVRTDVTAPAVAEIFKEIRGVLEQPLPQNELQKSKDALARSLPGAFETSAEVAGSYSTVYIYNLGLDYYSRYADQVNAVSAEQALGSARKYLEPDRLKVVAIGDRAKIEPELRKLNLGPIEVRDGDGRPLANQ